MVPLLCVGHDKTAAGVAAAAPTFQLNNLKRLGGGIGVQMGNQVVALTIKQSSLLTS